MISHEHHLSWPKVGIALTAGVCWVLAVGLFCRYAAAEQSVEAGERWILAVAGWALGAGAFLLVARVLAAHRDEHDPI